jgi:tetratricopeptide (TPR) repeat protein
VLALGACAPTLPRRYQEQRAAAERAYAAGRYEEAAHHWELAAGAADRRRDRSEALYRAGASYERAGRHGDAEASYEKIAARFPKSSRAARADFDRARIEIEHGNREHGYALLERAMFAHADSGLAPRALRELLLRAEDRGGKAFARAELERLLPRLTRTPLAERALYARAALLDEQGDRAGARDQYLEVARRFSYPTGALWDDALWHAARLENDLGNPRKAISYLERMLAQRESSFLQGSYERPRYAEAQFRIAELYRDRLGDTGRARREFRKVWENHPTSLLKDDALWNEALLARGAGDRRAACASVALLADEAPDSRYVPCGKLLCESAAADPKRSCRGYIERAVRSQLAGRGETTVSPR